MEELELSTPSKEKEDEVLAIAQDVLSEFEDAFMELAK